MAERRPIQRGDDHVGLLTDGDEADIAERMRTLLQRPISQEDLVENTLAVAASADVADRITTTLLVAVLGSERLAFGAAIVRRIVHPRRIHRIPHRTADAFAGLCSVLGELLPVARLDRLLGITAGAPDRNDAGRGEASDRRRMIVLDAGEGPWVVAVDRVEGVRRVEPSTFLAPPPTVRRALDGIADAIVPLEHGVLAARLDPQRLAKALERILA
jgi:chemotaxis signal transduction protein